RSSRVARVLLDLGDESLVERGEAADQSVGALRGEPDIRRSERGDEDRWHHAAVAESHRRAGRPDLLARHPTPEIIEPGTEFAGRRVAETTVPDRAVAGTETEHESLRSRFGDRQRRSRGHTRMP